MNGVSKALCHDGWRIGYAGGPRHRSSPPCRKVQSQSTSNPCRSPARGPRRPHRSPGLLADWRATFARRRDLVAGRLARHPRHRTARAPTEPSTSTRGSRASSAGRPPGAAVSARTRISPWRFSRRRRRVVHGRGLRSFASLPRQLPSVGRHAERGLRPDRAVLQGALLTAQGAKTGR